MKVGEHPLAPLPLTSRTLYDSTFGDLSGFVHLLAHTLNNGPANVMLHAGTHTQPTHGFAVPLSAGELTLAGDPPASLIEAWLDEVARLHLTHGMPYIGVWRNPATGDAHLDINRVFVSRIDARLCAVSDGCESFWDVENREPIHTSRKYAS